MEIRKKIAIYKKPLQTQFHAGSSPLLQIVSLTRFTDSKNQPKTTIFIYNATKYNKLCLNLSDCAKVIRIMQIENPSNHTQWGLPSGAIARLAKGAIRDIKYSPDGSKLAAATYIGIWIYDTRTCTEITYLKGHTGPVYSLTFLPDGTTLASTGDDDTIRL